MRTGLEPESSSLGKVGGPVELCEFAAKTEPTARGILESNLDYGQKTIPN